MVPAWGSTRPLKWIDQYRRIHTSPAVYVNLESKGREAKVGTEGTQDGRTRHSKHRDEEDEDEED